MRILTAIGARPQFIKAAMVSKSLARIGVDEVLVHSGQHYDHGMSQVFFDELEIPSPQVNLGVGSGSHAEQTAAMLIGFERAIIDTSPDWVVVHGDTNSTLAATLAAVKLGVRVAHNEAGLRSFNRSMPEEHNRILTDHSADLLLCPTESACEQLRIEGIRQRVERVGDVMLDASLHYAAIAQQRSSILAALGLTPGGYVLATLHRPYTVDVPDRLERVLTALGRGAEPVVLPCHPRTARRISERNFPTPSSIRFIDPVGYLDMIALEQNARIIVTDSGGVQKEAYFFSVPCVTARPETEWVETVNAGWNRVVDVDGDMISDLLSRRWWPTDHPSIFGDGHAADRIAELLVGSP